MKAKIRENDTRRHQTVAIMNRSNEWGRHFFDVERMPIPLVPQNEQRQQDRNQTANAINLVGNGGEWGRHYFDVDPGTQNQQRKRRKRDRQQTANTAHLGTAPTNNNVIDLLDDDDDEDTANANTKANKNGQNVIDLSSKPAADRKPSPVTDGEVQILDTPQRKPPPAASFAAPPSNIMRVLEIFPDADIEYVRKKLREQNGNIEVVVAVLTENTNYPKQKKEEGKPKPANHNSTVIKSSNDKWKVPKHNYSSPSAEFERSRLYKLEVEDLLLGQFCFLKKNGLMSLLRQFDYRYTLVRNHIHDLILGKTTNDPPPVAAAPGSKAAEQQEELEIQHYKMFSALKHTIVSKELKERLPSKYCLKNPRRTYWCRLPEDKILCDEHVQYERKVKAWGKKIRNRMRSKSANKMALENGTAVSCCCCFDDVARSECVPCKEKGHLFCKDCIVQYVESQVFGSGNLGIDRETKKPALEIKCCEGSGCNSGFHENLLRKVLPGKTWEKYSEMQIKAQLDLAGLGGNLAMCPKCGYQAEVPEMQNIFDCPVEGCHFSSCRKCGKASHIPLRCEEVAQQNRRDEGRLKIEEALSEAKMRTCPKCNKKFIKSDGCNKMTCACGAKMCYVCRQPLTHLKNKVYSHFCQVPHCDHSSCGMCLMYTNDAEDDAQAMREAGIAAKETYEQKLQSEGGEPVENLKLSVDEIMADPFRPSYEPKRQRRAGNQQRPDPRPEFMRRDRAGNQQRPQRPDPRPENVQWYPPGTQQRRRRTDPRPEFLQRDPPGGRGRRNHR